MYTIDSQGHVCNTDGWIFLRYFQPIQKLVEIGGNSYVFVPQCNVSGCWVRPQDVSRILDIRRECCGGQRTASFGYSNEENARLWLGLGR